MRGFGSTGLIYIWVCMELWRGGVRGVSYVCLFLDERRVRNCISWCYRSKMIGIYNVCLPLFLNSKGTA